MLTVNGSMMRALLLALLALQQAWS